MESFWKQLAFVEGAVEINDKDISLLKTGIDVPWSNAIFHINVNVANNAAINSALKNLANLPFFVWLKNKPVTDEPLNHLLQEQQLSYLGEIKGMGLDLAKFESEAQKLTGFEFKVVESEKDFFDWINIEKIACKLENKGAQQYCTAWKQLAKKGASTQHIIAYHAKTPAAIMTYFLHEKIVGLYDGATLPEFRCKGLATQLALYCLNQSKKRGAKIVVLQAMQSSFSLLQKISFKMYSNYYVYHAAGA